MGTVVFVRRRTIAGMTDVICHHAAFCVVLLAGRGRIAPWEFGALQQYDSPGTITGITERESTPR
jgi:hypothetical protein